LERQLSADSSTRELSIGMRANSVLLPTADTLLVTSAMETSAPVSGAAELV